MLLSPLRRIPLVLFAWWAWGAGDSWAGESSSPFKVQVNVISTTRIEARDVVRSVELRTKGRGGEVSIPAAMRLAMTSPGATLDVSFDLRDPFVERVEVQGLGEKIVVGPLGYQEVIALPRDPSALTIGYSITYRPGVPDGVRPLPIYASIIVIY